MSHMWRTKQEAVRLEHVIGISSFKLLFCVNLSTRLFSVNKKFILETSGKFLVKATVERQWGSGG